MTDSLAIALAQLNPTVGDIAGNARAILAARAEAAGQGAELLVTGELGLVGYPPEDLVLKPAFLDEARAELERLAAATADGGPGMLVGLPWRAEGAEAPLREQVYNAIALLDGGEIRTLRFKHELPNYGVFDELRVFRPGPLPGPVSFRGVRLGVAICEDIWQPDVAECLAESGAEILVVPNGSPFETAKTDTRLLHAVGRVTETGLPLVYLNQVGGQDELVFDGGSFVLGADRSLRAQLPRFEEALAVTRWRRGPAELWTCEMLPGVAPEEGPAATYRALQLALRDYLRKNGFPGVLLGLSGGIDSALSAAIAVDALGPERVRCVMLPSRHTGPESLEDAAACAALLGVRLDRVDIEPATGAFQAMLAPLLESQEASVGAGDTTAENLQARARGVTLMALSNALGAMVLSTGNKSETSVGYTTLYGDMCGGFNVLKDIYKTEVYRLARWRNEAGPGQPRDGMGPAGRVIPERILTKAPSAELRPGQTDQDSLPPYEDLDAILEGLVEEELGVAEIAARGHEQAVVERVWRLLEAAEYKRRQAPPGAKITRRAFGRDRRYPISNAFRGPA